MSVIIPTVKLLKRFIGRPDVYNLQYPNGGWSPIYKTIDDKVLLKHLRGEHTISTYPVPENNMVSVGTIDIDDDDKKNPDLEALERMARFIMSIFKDYERFLEFSGRRGYHVWIMFKKKERAEWVKYLIERKLAEFGMFEVEVFPKQGYNKDGLGNSIKLPGCIHLMSGKRSVILEHKQAGEL